MNTEKLEKTLNRLYKENKISIDTYTELMEFADPNQALQLLQPDVSGSKCSRKCKECNKLVFDCSDFCCKRCETAYYR
jgi:hypothetical protein